MSRPCPIILHHPFPIFPLSVYLAVASPITRYLIASCYTRVMPFPPYTTPHDPTSLLFSFRTLWYFTASRCTIKDYLLLLGIGSKVSCLVPLSSSQSSALLSYSCSG